MPVIACIGHSGTRWILDYCEANVESGITIHDSAEFWKFGGGSIRQWIDAIDDDQHVGWFRWLMFQDDITAHGSDPDAVWIQIAARDAVTASEPYPTQDECDALIDYARTFAGSATPFCINAHGHLENCTNVSYEGQDVSVAVAAYMKSLPNCEAGMVMDTTPDSITDDGCHAEERFRLPRALEFQARFGASGSQWS